MQTPIQRAVMIAQQRFDSDDYGTVEMITRELSSEPWDIYHEDAEKIACAAVKLTRDGNADIEELIQ